MSGETRTPQEWCDLRGIFILDPDGWRMKDAPAWDTPIPEPEFWWRAALCTIRMDARARDYFEVRP